MKNTILLLPLAFVLGGLAGAWGPVAELRELKARPAKDSASTGGRTQGFDAFARLVNIPDVARHRPHRTPAASQKPKAGDSAPAQTPTVAESPAKDSPAPAPRRPSPSFAGGFARTHRRGGRAVAHAQRTSSRPVAYGARCR